MFASASGPRKEFYENQPEGGKCHPFYGILSNAEGLPVEPSLLCIVGV